MVEPDRSQMAHAHCMLDAVGYKYTLTICNTYNFFTAKMVARAGPNIKLYVQCLSCEELY
jgi:hypothetical protein